MQEYTKVASVDNEFEAQLLDAILEERQIPHRLKSYYDSAYNGIFQGQKGWGAVYAPENFHAEVGEILHEIRSES